MSLPLRIGAVVIGVVVVVFAVLWFGVFPQSVQSAGNKKEQTIATAYEDGANVLSSCINQTDGAAQTALANTAAFDAIVRQAVSGTGAAQSYQLTQRDGSPNATAQSGLYALFVKAYPDTSGMSALYQQVVTIIAGCQTSFQHAQTYVLDVVRDFKAWRSGSWMTRQFGGSGYPNDQLSITLPGVRGATPTYVGNAALALASVPIVDSAAATAYGTGVYTPPNPYATASPSVSSSASG